MGIMGDIGMMNNDPTHPRILFFPSIYDSCQSHHSHSSHQSHQSHRSDHRNTPEVMTPRMSKKIEVLAREVRFTGVNDQDYICQTDIGCYKNADASDDLIDIDNRITYCLTAGNPAERARGA